MGTFWVSHPFSTGKKEEVILVNLALQNVNLEVLRGWKNENTKRQLVKKEGKGINKRRN